jgi:hypothetical protein
LVFICYQMHGVAQSKWYQCFRYISHLDNFGQIINHHSNFHPILGNHWNSLPPAIFHVSYVTLKVHFALDGLVAILWEFFCLYYDCPITFVISCYRCGHSIEKSCPDVPLGYKYQSITSLLVWSKFQLSKIEINNNKALN